MLKILSRWSATFFFRNSYNIRVDRLAVKTKWSHFRDWNPEASKMSKRRLSSGGSCGRGYNRKVPPSRRNKKCRKLYDSPLKKRKGTLSIFYVILVWVGILCLVNKLNRSPFRVRMVCEVSFKCALIMGFVCIPFCFVQGMFVSVPHTTTGKEGNSAQ